MNKKELQKLDKEQLISLLLRQDRILKKLEEVYYQVSDEQKSAEVLDAIEQEARNERQAKEEYVFLFGHYYKEEDFWDWYYKEFCK